ncbi:MAG: cupin domain-containing protein [Melioribacteraceae bacterium]|nr:cupin domain-containing protein [Melioribacteraceae bacterium]
MKKFIYIILFVTQIIFSQQQEKKFDIEDCVNPFNSEKIESTKVGYQYWFVNKDFLDGRTIKLSVVKPKSATHPPHKHIEDEFFFVIEGKAEFYLEGKTKQVEGFASFYCPSNYEHGIKNIGDTVLKYLVIKKYPLNKN